MVGRKVALLIGVNKCSGNLPPLQCPVNGVRELRDILENRDIGAFDEVICLEDPSVSRMQSQIVQTFDQLGKKDLLLFYFTGHGVKTMGGHLYLTTRETSFLDNQNLNVGTAVPASFVKTQLSECYARSKVVIVDCCFGAAFAKGYMTMGEGDGLGEQLSINDADGQGWAILTASTALGYALEQENQPLSVYTRHLTEGLKSGSASPKEGAFITTLSLHKYIRRKVQSAVSEMSPESYFGENGQDIQIARAKIQNSEHTYREAVRRKIRKNKIGGAGRAYLDTLRQQLQLSLERAMELEVEELKPHNQKTQYQDAFLRGLISELKAELPPTDTAIADLRDLQNLLNLGDDEVRPILAQVLIDMSVDDPEAIISCYFSQETNETPPPSAFKAANEQAVHDLPLSSEVGVDYQPLRQLLQSQQWQAANHSTRQLILKVADRSSEGYLSPADWVEFPATDLQTINQLWCRYSNNRFGFMSQIAVWQATGAGVTLDAIRSVAKQLGWKPPGGHFITNQEEFTFSLNAPAGHLPTPLSRLGSLSEQFQQISQKLSS